MASDAYTFEIKGAKELHENLGRSREDVLASLNIALREIGKIMVPALQAATPIGATGRLRNTTVFQVLGRAEDQRLEVRQAARSLNGYFYGGAVRGGTRPHFPPYRALIPWVIKKLSVSADEAPRVAFLVARKISRVGTKENPYHVDVVRKKMGDIEKIVTQAGIKVAVKLAQTGGR